MQVLTGEDPTPSDDVFSLACLLYRLLAGYRVFGPRNAAEAAAEGMTPQCPQGLGEARWRVLKKALAYSRVARFDTMNDFIEALDIGTDEPITITVPLRDDLDLHDDSHGPARWIVGLIVLLGLLAGAGYQAGMLDDVVARFRPAIPAIPDVVSLPPIAASEIAPVAESVSAPVLSADDADASAEDAVTALTADAAQVIDADAIVDGPGTNIADASESPIAMELAPPLVDFSRLPPPTTELNITMGAAQVTAASVTMREGRAPVIIDFVRSEATDALTLRLEEVGFSGNRSPWLSGEYAITESEFVEFPAGQERARITLAMRSDPLREADQQSTLRLREVDNPSSELASITVYLEDDDQRAFEATLPANTVAFAVSQISVRERDPAVQIDIQRFNPDDTRLVVGYVLRDITATQGEDYFAPSSYTIEFAPNQRSARLLIPLVQDFVFEDNEAFSVELATAESSADSGIFQRTAIIIRDDDS
jgi:hypothetical protein